LISVKHDDNGTYTCIQCCGIEDVLDIATKEDLWKHLEDYHGWPRNNKEILDVREHTPKPY
jgi:hypothetical protein